MVTMAQRIEALRTEKGLSRPALAAALGLPRLSIVVAQSGDSGRSDGAVFSALLKSDSFKALVRETVLDVLKSPEGQALLAKAAKK